MEQTPEEREKEYLELFPSDSGKLAYYLSNEITFLHLKWKEYREIYGNEPEIIDLINEVAGFFFWMHERTLRHDIFFTMARILDPAYSGRGTSKPNATLDKLISELQPHTDLENIKTWETELEHLKSESKTLLDIRNKILSHNDFDTHVIHSPEILSGISRQQVEDLLELIRNLFNKINLHFRNSEVGFNYIFKPLDGSQALIAFIKSNINR